MCGIVGYLSLYPDVSAANNAIIERMTDALIYRGPDDSGVWHDNAQGIFLGHRRLSILDLSPAGHQPMVSRCGRYALIFNGEIYNHLQLRADLERQHSSQSWIGTSDTETILALIVNKGLAQTLSLITGMFSIALWDREEAALYLARDRVGEKPLYYGWQRDTFVFGSELKALKLHPEFLKEIDRDALAIYLRRNYVPAPYSIYKGIKKLTPGTYLRVTGNTRQAEEVSYWSFEDAYKRGRNVPFKGSEKDLIDGLETHLGASVESQMLADVPVGALLSGGIDSSLVCSLMQSRSQRPIKTFTIGFDDKTFNEAVHAKSVAKHLGTDHTELYLRANDVLDVVPSLPNFWDEPFADSSQLPTYMVMKLAKEQVTVALSGDGGDELFCGYTRYFMAPKIWRNIAWMPPAMRHHLSKMLGWVSADTINRYGAMFGTSANFAQIGNKIDKLSQRLGVVNSVDDFYLSLVTEWSGVDHLVIGASPSCALLESREDWPDIEDPRNRMMLLDSLTYLPDDILTKVDRAAMSNSLETRAPFLDKDLIEFAWQIPINMKCLDGKGKWPLRQLLYRYVPKDLVERPKMGFGIPLDSWLRCELRGWAEELLDEGRLQREGYFNPQPIRSAWEKHLSGSVNFGYRLWSVLMFQAWLEQEG